MRNQSGMVCMLLAGGQGSRLKALTRNTAKPAVPFGGKYRIIDFALSNATNSDIHDIGILTQYKPFRLNEHIGIGAAWDYDRTYGGLRLLSPFYSEEGGRWYDGTANAIYENMTYLDNLNPKYVLILSGDHIYKMNYNELLDVHIRKGAEATIAVMEVPWNEAPRFGIMNTDEEDRIIEFEEKPAKPKSNLASMGIYIFNWPTLRKALIEDYKDKNSTYDFGHDIIPKMLKAQMPLYVYRFKGYWKDVGTIKSYWEANLDMIDPNNGLNIYEKNWRIYTSAKNLPPHFIAQEAEVSNSLVNEACRVYGKVQHCVLFTNVTVEEGAEVRDSVILSGSVIQKGAKVVHAVVGENEVIRAGQEIGEDTSGAVYLVADGNVTEE
ncbi:glucose-1-phosphate adenylyltransferase [Levyella massiliensis]|mgnify:FL=1|uniref:glucose-1-phosphate adenylyltransferase n=1 Tax=Levyella massiliensis TaxID=938289 RepID=UPI0023F1C510|nr:glucose-1-phosphate adenylyltransferase [Levyella massiliensis]